MLYTPKPMQTDNEVTVTRSAQKLSNSFQIELPWPSSSLSPNGRQHWAQLAKAKKEANKRKPAECYPESQEPCYTAADGALGADGTAGRGVCKEGIRQCDTEGFWQTCEGAVLPAKELCNEVDDDCDDFVDEAYAPQVTSCGVGACAATGMSSCVSGEVQDDCSPGSGTGADDDCDGVNDDCDSATDESYVGAPTTCGTGARSGTFWSNSR